MCCFQAPGATCLLLPLACAGAIQVQRGNLSIRDSEVSGNTAHRNGGALKVDTVKKEVKDDKGNTRFVLIPSNLWLTNVIMRKNIAEANGGGCVTAAVTTDKLA
jgi:hypothetical protein